MDPGSKDIEYLINKLNLLISKHDALSSEISEVRSAIEKISAVQRGKVPEADKPPSLKENRPEPLVEGKARMTDSSRPADCKPSGPAEEQPVLTLGHKVKKQSTGTAGIRIPKIIQSNLEDFIGTNLFNKIGIVVIIIGIAIGTKFAIDRNLISPMVRLVLGYVLGMGMLFFAYRLKKNYHNFSAVLCSGSMAILYFMTYAGIAFFDIFSANVAFSIMTAITLFTVYQALNYDRQVISILGLVGAYAIPFLTGGDPEKYTVLFAYITIINFGILLVAIRKYWQLLYYAAFASTWLIYVLWWEGADFESRTVFQNSLIFSGIYFLIFYSSFLINKVLNKIKFSIEDVLLILSNTFIFYGLAYVSFDNDIWRDLLGTFTLVIASIHLLVWVVIYFQKERDENLLWLTFSLVITFITIAIPVEYDGSWITLFWIIEGAALFLIGRMRKAYFYEFLAYPLIVLSLMRLLIDWRMIFMKYASLAYEAGYQLFLNFNFMVSLVVILCLVVVNLVYFNPKYPVWQDLDPTFKRMTRYFLGLSLIFVTYYTFRFELAVYFRQLYADSEVIGSAENIGNNIIRNQDILYVKNSWILIYSMAFFGLITIFNIVRIRNEEVGELVLIADVFTLFVFLLQGLFVLSELRESYLYPLYPEAYPPEPGFLWVRYIGLLVFMGMLAVMRWQMQQNYMKKDLGMYFDLFVSLTILWILSSELLEWLDLGGFSSNYKLGLSILWGSYSLLLIVIGIWKKLKYLRIAAIMLFGITLAKLALYDISDMDTLSKTIVFILLGILLLVISFLYNKYRKIIF